MEETNHTMPVIDCDDVEFSTHDPNNSSTNLGEIPSCGSFDDSILDEFLRDNDTHACTHFHTCNGEFPHTHTCVHMHTKIVPPSSSNDNNDNDNDNDNDDSADSRRKRGREGGGNREAVRKYRLKKKAYTASLANELVSLRAMNQQLVQRLQRQVGLESEVARLKCLLVDIRGRIEGEIGSFPYQKTVANTNFPGSCSVPCDVQRDVGKSPQGCEFQKLNSMASLGSTPSFN